MSKEISAVDKSIVLIGFMGVGKTTVGEAVARKLGRSFVDIDVELEKQFGLSVPEIFETYGEELFRSREKELVLDYSMQKNKVISLGGGAFLQDEVRQACVSRCMVFHLDLSWDTWQKDRLHKIADSRPVLNGLSSEEMKKLYDTRKPIYAIHHHKFPLDRFNVDQAADLIVNTVHEQILAAMRAKLD